MTVPEEHQLKIALRTLRMPDVMVEILGGMTKVEAKEIVEKNRRNRKRSKNDR